MKNILLLASMLVTTLCYGQNSIHQCGSADYLNEIDANNPGFKQYVESITDHSNYKTRGTTITIPVVFHVVYNSASENLADTYLNAQIELLNNCFARTNADTSNMRSIFKSRVGASKIRFILDQIIRVSTTATSFDASSTTGHAGSDLVKFNASGGSDAISPDTKLNVWICDLTKDGQDLLAGYAYPPYGAPLWPMGSNAPAGCDGIVVDYLFVGGPSKTPLGYWTWGARGKALVHETGHYLGIRHIWGDDGGACQGQSGYHDDGISDTPVVGDNSNFDCDTIKNTCIETSGDLPDMVENYMDYSKESCYNSFTKLQINAMEYVLDNLRSTVRVPLAINELDELAKKITIYPNPTSDFVTIDLNRANYTNVKLRLTNSLGQVMQVISLNKSNSPLILETLHWAKGIYFVSIQFDNKQAISQKLYIQ